jgi:hypothetical protein
VFLAIFGNIYCLTYRADDVKENMIVATVAGKNYDPSQQKWYYDDNKLYVNDIRVVYSTDLFKSSQWFDDDVHDILVATNKLVLLTTANDEFQLSYGIYNKDTFYQERIKTNVEVPFNRLTIVLLLSESANYNVYYIGYTNNKFEVGDVFISNTHDSIWNQTLSNVPLTRDKFEYTIDFHKVSKA